MNDAIMSLEEEYCPPLDTALVSAILSDYDLDDHDALAAARQTLDALRADAVEEEATSFDPSGAHYADVEDNLTSDHGDSSAVKSDTDDGTSLSNRMRTLALEVGSDHDADHAREKEEFLEDMEHLDEQTKELRLKEMFPNVNDYTITYTLKKCNENWNRAMEQLLNHAFLMGEELVDGEHRVKTHGVDGFSEDNTARRGRKRKDKRKVRTMDDDLRSSSTPAMSDAITPRHWDSAKTDIDFISTRTSVSMSAIASLYHKNGASLNATIIALLETTSIIAATKTSASSPNIVAQASDLGKDFPAISPAHLVPLTRLTHPSAVAARELAEALVSPKSHKTGGRRVEIIPSYSPLSLSDEETRSPSFPRASSQSTVHTPLHIHDPAALAETYGRGQQRAYEQASAAYRRGKSDHLMAAAAGYYSQVGRDHATKRAEATAEAADALVAAQSSAGQVDLHGVTVKDAVRIARQKVESWWRHGGGKGIKGLDGRVVKEATTGQGLKIVTGVGRHSEGGVAKIGPAVGRMLASEGWKVVAGEGVLTVTGKHR